MIKNLQILLISSFLFITVSLLPASLRAQLVNYGSNGTRVSASGEKVCIQIEKKADHGNKALLGPISFSGVVGSVIGLAIDVTKSILSTAEAKYTATYSAGKSENELIYFHKPGDPSSADLNIERVIVTRSFLNGNGDSVLGCQFYLSTDMPDNSGLFRFHLDSLNLPYSKAKIKKSGSRGKRIDLSITIKLDAFWQDAMAKEPTTPSSSAVTKAVSSTTENSSQMKTGTLGETTFFVHSVIPEGKIRLPNDSYSGWYQLLPATALKFGNAENKWKVGNYTLTVTVKEANPYGINAKNMADFFSTSGTDLGSFLKQFFPNPSIKN